MSTLLQQTLEKRLNNNNNASNRSLSDDETVDSDDEFVNVVSAPGTPVRSRAPTRPTSPSHDPNDPSGRSRTSLSRLSESKRKATDPLKLLPTDVSQKIFSKLKITELAKCARVSKKWARSQTINYVWFQHYRKENFHDESLPPGKWTKRESKQNWRVVYLQSTPGRESRGSGYSTPSSMSGYQTPREIKEEKWRMEADGAGKPNKVEMRGMYKELGGRKAKSKSKFGSTGVRDKGGWGADAGGGDYDAPW